MEKLKKDTDNVMLNAYGVSTCTFHRRNKNRAVSKGFYLIVSVLVIMTVCITGCGKKKKISYGDTPGVATGTIDLSGDGAVLAIDNIKAEVGEDIDYTSKIDVIADDGNYTVDVNASNVKYDIPGTYNVGYTVKSDKGIYTSNVKVTITDNQSQELAGDVQPDNTNADVISNDNSSQGNQDIEGQQGNSAQPAQQDNNVVNNQNNNNTGSQNNQSGNNNSGNNNGNSGQGNSGEKQQETSRVLITGNNTTYKPKNIENAVIELLSGDVVTISCATNKYIVETRTDEATVEKNGHHYQVSKLIVVFNTGAERTLETVEKKID